MSSRFVSAGSLDNPAQAADKDAAWAKAKEDLEVSRKKKEEAQQEGGKTLYEVLQANKAAKQEAFEESIRLKNQLQSLNEEDADYLESVAQAERDRKAASTREASEQLATFRKQQEEAERAAALLGEQGSPVEEVETWVVSKKRKKNKQEKDFLKSAKLRRTSTVEKDSTQSSKDGVEEKEIKTKDTTKGSSPPKETPEPAPTKTTPLAGLLGAYSSDEDD